MRRMLLLVSASLLTGILLAQEDRHSRPFKEPKAKMHKHQKPQAGQLFVIPASLKEEHYVLHQKLAAATHLPHKTGAAARALAKILHSHFVKEEAYALPALGLLPVLHTGKITHDLALAIDLGDQLEKEWEQMITEHQQITSALKTLSQAAREENLPDVVQFSESLRLHAQMEEEVLYPTAVLIGRYVKSLLR